MMWLMHSLCQRRRQPEIQDRLDLDSDHLRQALVGLEHINSWSRSPHLLWPAIQSLAKQTGSQLRILDIATGAGDVPIRLWQLARRNGLAIQVEGCDLNARTIAHAQTQAKRNKADVQFFLLDVLKDKIPNHYDVVMCSLFLHHLSDQQAVFLLGAMAEAANRMVLVSDLVRATAGLALAYFGTRLLSPSNVNWIDSVRSVRAAFTIQEIQTLAGRAGLTGTAVERRWPCRFLLTWKRL